MEQSKAMEYESRKASSDVSKPRNISMRSELLVAYEKFGQLPLLTV
jgi:hypothetical protein